MYKKSFLSLMIMLLLATTSCSSEEPAAIEPGRTISGDAGKTLIVYFSWGRQYPDSRQSYPRPYRWRHRGSGNGRSLSRYL